MPFLSLVLFLLTSWLKCHDGREITTKPTQFTSRHLPIVNSLLVQAFPSKYALISLKRKHLSRLPVQHATTSSMHMMNFFLSFSNQFSKVFIPFIPHVIKPISHPSLREREKRTGVTSCSFTKGGCSMYSWNDQAKSSYSGWQRWRNTMQRRSMKAKMQMAIEIQWCSN